MVSQNIALNGTEVAAVDGQELVMAVQYHPTFERIASPLSKSLQRELRRVLEKEIELKLKKKKLDRQGQRRRVPKRLAKKLRNYKKCVLRLASRQTAVEQRVAAELQALSDDASKTTATTEKLRFAIPADYQILPVGVASLLNALNEMSEEPVKIPFSPEVNRQEQRPSMNCKSENEKEKKDEEEEEEVESMSCEMSRIIEVEPSAMTHPAPSLPAVALAVPAIVPRRPSTVLHIRVPSPPERCVNYTNNNSLMSNSDLSVESDLNASSCFPMTMMRETDSTMCVPPLFASPVTVSSLIPNPSERYSWPRVFSRKTDSTTRPC